MIILCFAIATVDSFIKIIYYFIIHVLILVDSIRSMFADNLSRFMSFCFCRGSVTGCSLAGVCPRNTFLIGHTKVRIRSDLSIERPDGSFRLRLIAFIKQKKVELD